MQDIKIQKPLKDKKQITLLGSGYSWTLPPLKKWLKKAIFQLFW